MNNQSKYVVITGASSGIGYESAKLFASKGYNLIIIARNMENLQKLKKEVTSGNRHIDVVIRQADLTERENLYTLYNSLKEYNISTWINNAGFGNYRSVAEQNLNKIEKLLDLNITALVILSTLFVHDYAEVEGSKLINISSAGGYIMVPTAVTYCASKFFVSSFTEGLAMELKESGAKLQAKVLAPAATETNFGNVANDIDNYDYDKSFGKYHTSRQMAEFLYELHKSDKIVGRIDRESFTFKLSNPVFPYAGGSGHNQKL